MAINAPIFPKYYPLNGVATSYAYDFKIFEDSDLEVKKLSLAGIESTLVLGVDYSVTGARSENGGTVELVSPGVNGERLTIRSNLTMTQPFVFRGQGSFKEERHEDAFDRVVRLINQATDTFNRSIRMPVSFAWSGEIVNVIPGYALGISADGTKVECVPNTGADQTADLANTTLASRGAGLVGYGRDVVYPRGTVGRRLNDLEINALWYLSDAELADVVGNVGSIDVSAKLQQAINAANGRVLFFPAGTYRIGTTLTYYNTSGIAKVQGFKLIGEGPGNTIFKNEVVGGPMLDINTGVGATGSVYFFSNGGILQGFSITGSVSFANSDGIRFRSCWDYQLSQIWINGMTRYGIHIDGDTGINPDCTASANMRLDNVRVEFCKINLYSPIGNGWPIAKASNFAFNYATDIGVVCNSSIITFANGSISGNGSAYVGTGDPDQSYGGILIGSASDYQAKSFVLDGIEFDNNKPQNVWFLNAKGPVMRGCNLVSRKIGSYVNKYSAVFGRDSASTYCGDFIVEGNTYNLPISLAASGLTHTFLLFKKYTHGGRVGLNGVSIAGGTTGTEIFYLREDEKTGSFTHAKFRTKFICQNGDQLRAAYVTPYDGQMPISKLAMGDDTAINFTPLSNQGCIYVSFNAAATVTALIGYDVAGGKTYILTTGSTGIDIKAVSTVLTGTTGTDGKVSVSVDATSGKIYIENRFGSTLNLTAQIIEGFGNWL